MSSSHFKDKQIMGILVSQKDELFELLKPSDDQNATKKGETYPILPDYDFAIATDSMNATNSGARVWSSAESRPSSSYRSLETSEPMKAPQERDKEIYRAVLMEEIDKTMKKHADNILRAMEGLSARLTQLESRTRHVEVSIDEFKVSVGNHHGSTDGRLRQLENILREIDYGVKVLRDKQEIAEAQSQLAKLQLPQAPEAPKSTQVEALPRQAIGSSPPQIVQAPPPPLPLPALPPPPNALSPPNASPPPPQQQQQLPPPTQMAPPPQLPPSQPPFYVPSPAPQTEFPHPQYHIPSQPQEQPPKQYQFPPPQSGQPPQSYQMPPHMMQAPPAGGNPLPPYPPPPQQHQPIPPPVNPLPPPPSHYPEETVPYMPPPQTYPPPLASRQQGTMAPSPNVPPASQPFYRPSQMYGPPPPSRTGSGQMPYHSGYGPPSGPNHSDSYAYSGSPSRYDEPLARSSQLPPAQSGGFSSYPRPPAALPHALPTASNMGGRSTSATGNRVAVDDVVERVAAMGFSRDQVLAIVRRLTENGQSVDLNVLLDKLMNDGEIQPQRVWFSR